VKRIQITILPDAYKKVEEALEANSLSYTWFPVSISGERGRVYSALVPDEQIDGVIDTVSKSIDLRLKGNTISVDDVEAVVSTHIERLREKTPENTAPTNPLERLVESTERYTRVNFNFVTIIGFTTIISLIGLYTENVAILIGAMLLSPMLGPINAFAVNACLGKLNKLVGSEISTWTLIGTVILISTLITKALSFFYAPAVTGMILSTGRVTLIDVILALILGLAGGLSLFTAMPETLIGVAVAVALVPPATVSGIALANLDLTLAAEAFTKTLVNILGLQLGGILMLTLKGVTPRRYYDKARAKTHRLYAVTVLGVMLLLIAVLIFLVL